MNDRVTLTMVLWTLGLPCAVFAAAGCQDVEPPSHPTGAPHDKMVAEAPPPSAPVPSLPEQLDLVQKANDYFRQSPSHRIYIQLDKPLYAPGETIWVRTVDVQTRDFSGVTGARTIACELISPRGSVVEKKWLHQENGYASNAFDLPLGMDGGEYKIRVTPLETPSEERPVIISTYQPPQFKKKLEFVRRAYGPGDEVSATVEVKRGTEEPLANRTLIAAPMLDGSPLPRVTFDTDEKGQGLVRFTLPDAIERGEGLLTILVEDGGITESVSKSIPIVLAKIKLSMFPEGGDLIAGLESRVYFAAENMIGKPADIAGEVKDEHGQVVARFTSIHDGMGHFTFTPGTGHRYQASISRPTGIPEQYALPVTLGKGCVLHSYDDPKSRLSDLRVSVRCTEARDVIVSAWLRERQWASATTHVEPETESTVYLRPGDPERAAMQGVLRITLFDDSLEPLAERLVYRNWNDNMKVKVTPNRDSYGPRDQVTLTVETRDLAGQPVAAQLALSVVDDTVLAYADDKTANILAHLYLEREIPGKLEEPNYYFKEEAEPERADPAVALDVLLGTRGWRKFAWKEVFAAQPPASPAMTEAFPMFAAEPMDMLAVKREAKKMNGGRDAEGRGPARGKAAVKGGRRALAPRGVDAPQPVIDAPLGQIAAVRADKANGGLAANPVAKKNKHARAARAQPAAKVRMAANRGMGRIAAKDEDRMVGEMKEMIGGLLEDNRALIGRRRKMPSGPTLAKVRLFPSPTYGESYDGPRTDFRQTVFWAPDVQTDVTGKATVSFYLSDAVTSFKVTTEGISSGGLVGRDETVLTSKLPFSMDIKLPNEVSEGDLVSLPLILTNEEPRPLAVTMNHRLPDLLELAGEDLPTNLELAPSQRRTFFLPLQVVGKEGEGEVRFAALASNLNDDFIKTIKVAPLGFPQEESLSGTLKGASSQQLVLSEPLPGTAHAFVKIYPSTLSTITSGLEAMLRQPYGCFEQASSSNYPNVMVMQMLQQNHAASPALVSRTNSFLDSGYRRLAGYESPERGYEWFGGNPGHEALTAYGLMQFADMKQVYGQVDAQMVVRTADWLMARRDGQGGFKRNSRALDSFGRASTEVTNAYITYALSEAGRTDIGRELEAVQKVAQGSSDPYIIALATNALLNAGRESAGRSLAARLTSLQKADGSWPGADHSITRSGGKNLTIETTALAVMAELEAGGFDEARKGVAWIMKNRGGYGGFGTTQATVLSLRALVAYTEAVRATQGRGTVVVTVNGQEVARKTLTGKEEESVRLGDFGNVLTAGANTIRLALSGGGSLPFSVGAEWRTRQPASSPEAQIQVETRLARTEVKMGETVRLTAKISSRSSSGLPMVLARIGIPGGLNFQPWQLKELREKKLVDFYETRAREVILYWRALEPNAVKEVPLELVAEVPGQYTGPASSAYLYYTDELKHWAAPVAAKITP